MDRLQGIDRLSPSDLFGLQYLRDARLSPDGAQVAYAVSATQEGRERVEIRIADADGSAWRTVPFHGNASSPRWSPDGQLLAFVGDGALRVLTLASGVISDALTPSGWTLQGAASWSPDSSCLTFTLMQASPKSVAVRRITTRHFRAEGVGYTSDLSQRVAVVELAAGRMRWLTEQSDGICTRPQWSPRGDRLLFFSSADAVPGSSYSPRLMVMPVGSGPARSLLDESWYITAATWLPDGEHIAITGAKNSTLTIPNASLWVVDCSDAKAVSRISGGDTKIGGMMHHDMPAWDLTGNTALIILDGETAFVTVVQRGGMEVWSVSLTGQLRSQRILTGDRSCFALDVNASTGRLLYAVSTLFSPTELWSCDLGGAYESRLTALNDAALAHWPKYAVERFSFTSADSLEIDTWFLRRADLNGPLPTVLFIHGGPFASTGHVFRYDLLMLSSWGYGVLFHNFRGSVGYGEAFTRGIMGDWGARGFPDHMGAVDAAVARNLADPGRLGVWGPSHGGFATSWIIGHTSRFKAAIVEAATVNLVTKYYLADSPETTVRDLGGRPSEIPDVYRARSPITYAHRCTTPTLLIHGEDDRRCPITEAEQFFRVLQDAGCVTELVRIANCNHMGDSAGPLSARLAQNEALLDWFQRYL